MNLFMWKVKRLWFYLTNQEFTAEFGQWYSTETKLFGPVKDEFEKEMRENAKFCARAAKALISSYETYYTDTTVGWKATFLLLGWKDYRDAWLNGMAE